MVDCDGHQTRGISSFRRASALHAEGERSIAAILHQRVFRQLFSDKNNYRILVTPAFHWKSPFSLKWKLSALAWLTRDKSNPCQSRGVGFACYLLISMPRQPNGSRRQSQELVSVGSNPTRGTNRRMGVAGAFNKFLQSSDISRQFNIKIPVSKTVSSS